MSVCVCVCVCLCVCVRAPRGGQRPPRLATVSEQLLETQASCPGAEIDTATCRLTRVATRRGVTSPRVGHSLPRNLSIEEWRGREMCPHGCFFNAWPIADIPAWDVLPVETRWDFGCPHSITWLIVLELQ